MDRPVPTSVGHRYHPAFTRLVLLPTHSLLSLHVLHTHFLTTLLSPPLPATRAPSGMRGGQR